MSRCTSCGIDLEHEPGDGVLCPGCGSEQPTESDALKIVRLEVEVDLLKGDVQAERAARRAVMLEALKDGRTPVVDANVKRVDELEDDLACYHDRIENLKRLLTRAHRERRAERYRLMANFRELRLLVAGGIR